MIYPIVLYGHPVLRQKAKDVLLGDQSVRELVSSLFETMYAAQGVGLASPQVGISLRVFVVDSMPVEGNEEDALKQAFINPRIIDKNGDPWSFEEGCLSIPGIREEISRKSGTVIQYFDENWQKYEQTFDGMKARIIQHEYDHIEGTLFTDHISSFKKRLLKGKLSNIRKGNADTSYRVKIPG